MLCPVHYTQCCLAYDPEAPVLLPPVVDVVMLLVVVGVLLVLVSPADFLPRSLSSSAAASLVTAACSVSK